MDGVPSHVGLVHAMLGGNCPPEAGYDSGSVGGGVGGAGIPPQGIRSPPPGDGPANSRTPGSHGMSDASDREEQAFAGSYRDCDVESSSQADTSQAEDTSQADTSQDFGHSDRESIAGYHTDTGAMSDGNSTTRHHHPSSRGGSVGGMSERSRSSAGAGSTTNDRPPAKVTIARPTYNPPMPPMVVGPGAGFHSLEAIASLHHNFPTANMSYGGPPSVSGKSDNATVNSGSMIEDIDMASIMSGDGSIAIGGGSGVNEKGSTPQPQPPALAASASIGTTSSAPSSYHQGLLPHQPILTKKGDHPHQKQHERGVEFATWAKSYPAPHPWLEGQQAPSITSRSPRSSPPTGRIVGIPPNVALNDMGPPLNRGMLFEKISGSAELTNQPTPGAQSRAGPVTSGSVGRPSDMSSHADTDDGAESLTEGNKSVLSQGSHRTSSSRNCDHNRQRKSRSPSK